MKLFKQIVLLFAFGINFLHASVPHKHHSGMTVFEDAKEHQNTQSVFDFISLFFHGDEGDVNLSNSKPCGSCILLDANNDAIPSSYFNFDLSFEKRTIKVPSISEQFISFNLAFYLDQRGPPVK